MQISVEETSKLGRKIELEIPAEEITSKMQKKVQEASRTIRLDGFRKGKIPTKVIQKKFGNQIRAELVNELMQEYANNSIKENEFKLASSPQVDNIENLDGTEEGNLKYSISFEVLPEFELVDFSEVALEKKVADITDEMIAERLELIRTRYADWKEKDAAIESGDRAEISYTSDMEQYGEFAYASMDSEVLEVKDGQILKEMYTELQGMKADETKEITCNFPEDWHDEALRGKDVKFSITVKKVLGKILAEINAELADNIDAESAELEDINSAIKNLLEKEHEEKSKKSMRQQIVDVLLSKHELDIPESMLKSEKDRILQQKKQSHKHQQQQIGNKEDSTDIELSEEDLKEAEKNIKLGMILSRITEEHKIELTDEEVSNKVYEFASMFARSQADFEKYAKSEYLVNQARETAIVDKTYDFVVEKSNVSEVKVELSQLVD